MDDKVLERLVSSFDDFKERLIRIEENVKSIGRVETELDVIKIKVAELDASTKSGHKRIDGVDGKIQEKEQDIKWLRRQFIGGAIGLGFTILAAIILAAAKGWI